MEPRTSLRKILGESEKDGNVLAMDCECSRERLRQFSVYDTKRWQGSTRPQVRLRGFGGRHPRRDDIGSLVRGEVVRESRPFKPSHYSGEHNAVWDECGQGKYSKNTLSAWARIHTGEHQTHRLQAKRALLPRLPQGGGQNGTQESKEARTLEKTSETRVRSVVRGA